MERLFIFQIVKINLLKEEIHLRDHQTAISIITLFNIESDHLQKEYLMPFRIRSFSKHEVLPDVKKKERKQKSKY